MHILDTHTILWILYDKEKLSDKARSAIQSDEVLFVSIVSLWEIAIKQSIGKLNILRSIEEIANACNLYGIKILPIDPAHLETMKKLPLIHRDPFDRLIIAQAMCEHLSLITRDGNIAKYDIATVW